MYKKNVSIKSEKCNKDRGRGSSSMELMVTEYKY